MGMAWGTDARAFSQIAEDISMMIQQEDQY